MGGLGHQASASKTQASGESVKQRNGVKEVLARTVHHKIAAAAKGHGEGLASLLHLDLHLRADRRVDGK